MTFLKNKSISKSFDEKMSVRSLDTQKTHKNVISNFDKFSKENYDGDAEINWWKSCEILYEMIL